MKILVLNSGSSSQKCSLYEMHEASSDYAPPPLWEARLEWVGSSSNVHIKKSGVSVFTGTKETRPRREEIADLVRGLWEGRAPLLRDAADVDIVGHRVVHGGPDFEEPTFLTGKVRETIAKVSAFAPLHNRDELDGIEIVEELLGTIPQVAVFDTGFHHRLPLAAAVYPGPYEWFARGIRRYGFHGISHQYCAQRASQLLGEDVASLKLVSCHLGNGCSLAAIDSGRSVDTTMGFSPLEGLMMGTRSGSVDPGILTYLMRQDSLNGWQLDDLLNRQSGLFGISGLSSDMRQILAAAREGNERAKLAFDIFIHRSRSGIGAMIAALGGIDALAFTGGIGENSPEVRCAACEPFDFMGLRLERAKNQEALWDREISSEDSKVRVLVIQAREEWALALACWKLAHA